MTSFDGGKRRQQTRPVAAKKRAPKQPRQAKDLPEHLSRVEEGLYVADQVGHELRMRGHALLFDAAQRRNKREQTAGHIMRELGSLVGQGGVWSAEELAALQRHDPVLEKLEEARAALAGAVQLERARRERHRAAAHEWQRAFVKSIGEPDPGPYVVVSSEDPSSPLLPDEKLKDIAKRYLALMLEWGDHTYESAEGIATWIEVARQMMQDTRLLGLRGTGDQHIAAWAAVIKPILHKDLRPSERAEHIIRACAREQGHTESEAKNLIRG
jgi:hypothetical protein